MKRILLISLLLPLCTTAQEVRPVISADYLSLIKNDSVLRTKEILTDSTNSMRGAILRYTDYNFSGQFTVGRILIKKDNSITLKPTNTKYLYIGGTASSAIELLQHNQLPATQKEYAQGRSAGGALVWQGPETGELFSFGPALSTLSHDGSTYIYDNNGRLVSGSGINPYDNNVFRNGSLLSNSLTLHARYKKGYYKMITASLKAGQSREQTIITTNKNKADNFSGFLNGTFEKFSFSGHYDFRQERFTHNNRNGFLNRVYQNSLLTPASFDNRQGNTIDEATQRSYSPNADNPFFLLADKGHSFLQQQQTSHLTLEQRINKVKIRLSQSFEELRQRSNEGYQPGTAFFAPGAAISRSTHDKNYSLNTNLSYNGSYFSNGHFRIQSTINYIYTSNRSAVAYSTDPFQYGYQRSSHDLSISFLPDFNGRINDTYVEGGLALTNKLYASNTSTADRFFLPSMSGYVSFRDVFNLRNITVKLFGGHDRFNSELPINRSFAYSNLLQYSVANSLEYLPLTEAKSLDNLAPIEHRESLAGIEVSYKYRTTFSASWFSRHTLHDIFPVMNGNEMNLVNVASHRNRGIELELRDNFYSKNRRFAFGNGISFVSYRNKVTDVAAGYNYMPIAGFTDVHKAIIKGEPLGVIVGNSWLRDAENNIIIGNDGFPLVNTTPKVIGNPMPDFTLKMTHRFSYKDKWTLNVDWEWKKGGDMWNGTQALLDYYGRSASSAALRNTTGYIFNGVLQSGSHNNIPVNFYDPSLPVEQNRWVRYGHSGVAESYIQKGDCIRLNTVGISYKPTIKKYLQDLTFTLYANNIILWSAYKGADPSQLLNDEPNTAGLDLFNLPSVRTIGFNVSLQF